MTINELFNKADIEKLKAQPYSGINGETSNLFSVLDQGVAKLNPGVVRAAEFSYIRPSHRNFREIVKIYDLLNHILGAANDKPDRQPDKEAFRHAFAKMFHMLDETTREGAFYRDAIVVALEELELEPVGQRHGLENDTGAAPAR
jgi:hypothetical protein